MESFDAIYKKRHNRIRNNQKLVEKLLRKAKKTSTADKYLVTGFKVSNMFLGLDLIEKHLWKFSDILAKMRLLYEATEGDVDLLKVYLGIRQPSDSDPLAIITQDVSRKGKYKIIDDAVWPKDAIREILFRLFVPDVGFSHITFGIYDPKKKLSCWPPTCHRYCLADLEHVKIKLRYLKKYEKYVKQYENDPNFWI